jgi:hypothetical protein
MWNDNGYKKPSVSKSSSGFAKDYGYGLEGWNNSERLVWRNYRVFYAPFQEDKLEKVINFAESGDLMILFGAMHQGAQYALGVAAGVTPNYSKTRKTIAAEIGLLKLKDEIWRVPGVSDNFDSRESFIKHWKEVYREVAFWKAPTSHFVWFSQPIAINPIQITGKKSLIKEHSSYQQLSPEQVLAIIGGHLQVGSSIYKWLRDGDFVSDKGAPRQPPGKQASRTAGRGSPCASDAFEYFVYGNRKVYPWHKDLQDKYESFLRSKGYRVKPNVGGVDVIYCLQDRLVLVEIKPTDVVETKYAIRSAVGQILEYGFLSKEKPMLEIVVGKKPQEVELDFVLSLGITLTYFDEETNMFIQIFPNN